MGGANLGELNRCRLDLFDSTFDVRGDDRIDTPDRASDLSERGETRPGLENACARCEMARDQFSQRK